MAGDWIKMRGNLWDDPRVMRLCDLTGSSEAAIIGGLYWLWATADQHSTDGILAGLSLRSVDRKTGIQGFGDALISIGWVEDHPEGIHLIRFDEHNGASAKTRATTAKRVAKFKSANATIVTEAAEGNADTVTSTLAVRYLEKEKEKEKEIKNNTPDKPAAPLRAADLVDLGVGEQIAKDFLAVRKAKRAPLTRTALDGLKREAELAGVSLSSALETCVLRGWQGFKADWLTGNQPQAAAPAAPANIYRYKTK